jgi:hypothetical protein
MAGEANIWNPRALLALSADTKRVTESIIATEGQFLFTLTAFTYAVDAGALAVYKNGVYLTPLSEWAEHSESTFSITVPATAGDKFDVVGFAGITGEVPALNTATTSGVLQMSNVISKDVAVAAGNNALSVNPTISAGVTVTVASGSEWVIVGN